MSKLHYDGLKLLLAYTRDDGSVYTYECHNQYEGGLNEYGEARASLPNGVYSNAWAETYEMAMKNGPSYGCGYIHTGDSRGRDIHGGGSSLEEPYADSQGWLCTYGCLRMQNKDVVELSAMMLEDGATYPGGGIELTVENNENAEEV